MPPHPPPPPTFPKTYHCLCTILLFSTTHTLSTLPLRKTTSTISSEAIILPLPTSPPVYQTNPSEQELTFPSPGYTILLNLLQDTKPTIIRREDGFEKRCLWRCTRCRTVIGYELVSGSGLGLGLGLAGKGLGEGLAGEGDEMDMDIDKGKGKEKEEEYHGRVMYILPGGCMSTEFMITGKKVAETDVDMGIGGKLVFE